jgi:hypothetical protein
VVHITLEKSKPSLEKWCIKHKKDQGHPMMSGAYNTQEIPSLEEWCI